MEHALTEATEANELDFPPQRSNDKGLVYCDIFDKGRELLVLQNFFRSKLPPRTAKTVFVNPKGPPLWMLEKKNSSNEVFIKAM